MPTTSKKILIFSTAYLPLIGGAEIAIKEITDRLSGEFEFHLITARLKKDLLSTEKVERVTVHRIGIGMPALDKFFLPYFGAWKVLKLNREHHFAAFWCVMASFASGAAYIANWFQKKVPIILTLQEGDSEKWLRYRWFGLIDLSWRLALARTNMLTAISTYLLDRARRLGYKGQAEVIPNGVDIKKFSNVQHRVFDKKKVVLITVSRLVEKNAIEDIIDALKFLPVDVGLKVLGTGILESKLKQKVKDRDLETRVEFLGNIPNHDIPKYLHEADIFVRPSLSEGQGISFIEAMAAEVPVIATPVGGIPDFLKDKDTGLFCKVGDSQSVADKVLEYLNDPVLIERVVKNAKNMVIQKYDWDLIANEMKTKVFDKV